MKSTPRWTDWCVSFFVVGLLFGTTVCLSADTEGIAWKPDGLRYVYGSENGHHWGQVSAVEFGPDGSWVVSGGGDNSIFIWDTASLKPIAFAGGLPDMAESVSVNPKGKFVAVGLSIGQVWIYSFDGQKLTELHRLTGFRRVCGVRYTPDGSKLIVVTDTTTHFYDVSGRYPVETRVLMSGGNSFDVSGDGYLLAVAEDEKLSVWNISDQLPKKIASKEGSFMAVAISPDCQSIATGHRSNDSLLALWHIGVDELKKTIEWENKNTSSIHSLRFSPDGKSLATTTYSDSEILVWDVNKIPEEVVRLRCQQPTSFGLAFAADSHRLVAGDDTAVRIWELGDEPAEAKQSNDRLNRISDVWYADDSRLLAVTHEIAK